MTSIPTVPLGPGGRSALVGKRVFSSPLARRISYAVVFEILAVIFTAILLFLLGNETSSSVVVGVVSSTVALTWNMVFNWLFEKWEHSSIGVTGRPWWVRLTHMLLFEGGLILFLVPIIALILGVTLWEAVLFQAILLVFFLIYTVVYAFIFDTIFGLPEPAENYPKFRIQD